ncbi:MAG: response regulator [Bacteroidales bacterium]|nr:response regulator [Bacteroidales bacterium]
MSKLKFLWIDDEDRSPAFENLKAQLKVEGKFINVTDEDSDYLTEIENIKPDLILIDHNLTETTGDIKKGSTLAAQIREKHPRFPIACITGQDDPIDTQQKLSYEAIYKLHQIEHNYQSMKAIAQSFRKLNSSNPLNVNQLLNLIKLPELDRIRLESIMPQEIKENFEDKALFQNISHWIRNVLIARPGFLYDRLWTATYLGLTEPGFDRVEDLFKAAKYRGLFADNTSERWWKSKLLEVLSRKVKTTELPWEKGRSLPGINLHFYSKDYYSTNKEDQPEVVAYIDDSSDERYPMKLKYTVLPLSMISFYILRILG